MLKARRWSFWKAKNKSSPMTVAEKSVRVAFHFASVPDFPDRQKTNAVCWNLRLGDARCCNKLLFALVDQSAVCWNLRLGDARCCNKLLFALVDQSAVCWNLRLGDACCCNKLLFALVDRSSVHDKHGELSDGTINWEKIRV